MDVQGVAMVGGGGLDQRESVQCVDEFIPLMFIAGGVSDLQIGDVGTIDLAYLGCRLRHPSDYRIC